MHTIELDSRTPPQQIVRADSLCVRLPAAPTRYYLHGWQSWSLAAWTDTARPLPISKPHAMHVMQADLPYASDAGHHGSWLGAVEMAHGQVLLLGALGLDAHVALRGRDLIGAYESGAGAWFIAHGDEATVFASYAAELGKVLGAASGKPAPRVWCSWYSLYNGIDEQLLHDVIDGLGDLPFDVIQVDDGWQAAIGDWEANARFPSGMQELARRIRATGRKAGIWLAPLMAVRSSRLFREHRGWFLRDARGRLVSAGYNWGEELYALDTSQPAVLEWLRLLMQRLRAWGYEYIKLDFLYAGALPGKRMGKPLPAVHAASPNPHRASGPPPPNDGDSATSDMTSARHLGEAGGGAFGVGLPLSREQAYRQGLQALCDGMGDDAYFVACGAPIIPSLGLCDALRTGPDVAEHWESYRDAVLLHNQAIPGTRNAIRTVLHRMWLRPLVQPDPDVVYFRSVDCSLSAEQKALLQDLAQICGFKATSDLPQTLSTDEREALRAYLESSPRIEQTGPRDFRIDGRELDYREAMQLAGAPAGWEAVKSAALGWVANRRLALRIDYALSQRALGKRIARLKDEGGRMKDEG